MRESIFFASLRSFFLALFGTAGIIMGVVVVALVIGLLSTSIEGQPVISYSYSPEIVANAEGVREALGADAPVILKLNIKGIVGVDQITRKAVNELLIESRERALKGDRVKAILLHVDSPGGTVSDADGIYRQIKAYKERYKVPVYAYVDGLCASGGVYIACAADKIYATESSLLGSVGVMLSSALNFSQLMEKIGVQSLTLYDGKGKDNLNPLRPWRKGEEDNFQASINYYYDVFVDIVTSNRPAMSKTKLIDVYGANVYPAPLAKEYGYIDVADATYGKALKELAEKAGLQDGKYQVVELKSSNWLSELFSSELGLLKGKVVHQIELKGEAQLQDKFLYLYH